MTRTLSLFVHALLLGAALAAGSARAQSSTASTPTDDALYQQLGAQPGLVKLVDDFMVRLLADPRMNPFFKDVDQAHVKAELVTQFCQVSGGPCRRRGPDMKQAHAGMDINKNNFNALVEVLQQAMDAQGIAFTAQNKLLAQLAPMHRDIINTP
ncbi:MULTISPECIES: group 1 truncated hemoglobin [unclassified Rhizobacter]|uniref:group I truncated hemoglobin n=1 Tax=unclassified Rhizobacter TaxID=2640088 RepID=UPI0006F38B45|nr:MULTISPECIES: group 1 truncated hemoglobin [unclassified Rhizobacter]KQU81370.1 globin [Rhizobacter sp. Root29]KQW09278.1 globin [Rhizobacter sp. Root1238]KRB18106.1 globin [Rhizobacter sp. Root16D2]